MPPALQVAEVLAHFPGDQAGVSGGFGQHGFARQEPVQVVGHFTSGSIAGGGVLFQGFEQNVLQIAGNGGSAAARQRGLVFAKARSRPERESAWNGGAPGEQFAKDGAQRKDVAASGVQRPAGRLFERQVLRSPLRPSAWRGGAMLLA